MADVTNIKFLYPPNFEGTHEAEAKGPKRYIVQCTNESDGTGEDEVIKVKRTDCLTTDGEIPGRLVIEKIEYDISGLAVKIGYNNVNDEVVAILYGSNGVLDFTAHGGFIPQVDDSETGGGDIIFTTQGDTYGDSYNIILTVRPKQ